MLLAVGKWGRLGELVGVQRSWQVVGHSDGRDDDAEEVSSEFDFGSVGPRGPLWGGVGDDGDDVLVDQMFGLEEVIGSVEGVDGDAFGESGIYRTTWLSVEGRANCKEIEQEFCIEARREAIQRCGHYIFRSDFVCECTCVGWNNGNTVVFCDTHYACELSLPDFHEVLPVVPF